MKEKLESMKNVRWLIYTLVGIVFGVVDFYLQLLVGRSAILACAVWLIPLLPIAIYEIKKSGSKLYTVLASVLVWVVAVVAYYLYLAIGYIQIGAWDFWGGIFRDIAEWSLVAIVGGSIIGFLVAVIYQKKKKVQVD